MHFNKKKFLFTSLLFFVFIFFSFSQNKMLTIEQDKKIGSALEIKKKVNKKLYNATIYTIQLYYGDVEAATKIKKDFDSNYPKWFSEIVFETPNYKIRVGRFRNLMNAKIKLEEIKYGYPAAFLLQL